MRKWVFVVSCLGILAGCSSEEKACQDSTMAFVMSQNFVKQHLKSPGTARFPTVSDRGVEVRYLGEKYGCQHYVGAYVDAQNSFGGTVRNHYSVIMEKVPGKDVWKASDLTIK